MKTQEPCSQKVKVDCSCSNSISLQCVKLQGQLSTTGNEQ